MPVRHVMPQAAEHLASKIADDHSATIRRRAPRTASCHWHASMQNLLSLAHLALVLLFLCCEPASSIEPINPFVGTPIIVDHAPEYSTPSASPAEHIVQSNEAPSSASPDMQIALSDMQFARSPRPPLPRPLSVQLDLPGHSSSPVIVLETPFLQPHDHSFFRYNFPRATLRTNILAVNPSNSQHDYDLSFHNPPVPDHVLVVVCVRPIASAQHFYSLSPREHAKLVWAEAFANVFTVRDACERVKKCKEDALGKGEERSWFMKESNSGADTCDDDCDCSGKDARAESSCSSSIAAEASPRSTLNPSFQCNGVSYRPSADPQPNASSDIIFPSLLLSREAVEIGSPFYRLHFDLPIFLNAADFHLKPDTMYAYHVHADAYGSSSTHQDLSSFSTSSEHFFMIRPPPLPSAPLLPPSCRSAPCGPNFAGAWRLDVDTKVERTRYSSIQPNGSQVGEYYFIRGVNGYESTRAFLLPQLDPFCNDGSQPVRSGSGDGGKYLCLNNIGSKFRSSSSNTSNSSSSDNSCLIYSIGSSNDFEFEKSAYAATGCDIHTFDCTVANATNRPPFVQFHPWCLGKGHMSLMEVMVALGHDKREISLLKMDCEGCEWSVFSHYRAFVSSGSMRPIRQLSFEVHISSFAAGWLQQFFDMFQWFYKSNYRVISWEPNGWGCTEYTLLLDERCSDACLL